MLGYVGPMFYVVFGDDTSEEDKDVFVRELARGIDARRDTDRVPVLYCVGPKVGSAVKLARGISQVVSQRQEKLRKTSVALALCTQSPFARATLRTVLTLGKLPYPTRVFSEPAPSLAFLSCFVPEVHTNTLAAELEQLVRARSPALGLQLWKARPETAA
jgi:hypothetical protein